MALDIASTFQGQEIAAEPYVRCQAITPGNSKEAFFQTKQALLPSNQALCPVAIVLPERKARESAGLLDNHTT